MLVFAISGYRQGFVIGALSFGGFFSGALIGLQLGPLIANQFADGAIRVVVSLVAIFGAGRARPGARRLARHPAAARSITSRPVQRADDVGGAVVSLVAVLLVAWLVAVPLGSSSLPWLASAVRNSAVLGGVDQVMPQQAQALSDALRDTVDTNGFPDVFGGLAPTRAREVARARPGAGRLAGRASTPSSRWSRCSARRRAARGGSRAPASSTPTSG